MEGGSALFNPGFLGGNFLWWVGQVADDSTWRDNISPGKFTDPKEVPGWGYRYKVRIIGLHDQEESSIPSDQLPWAQVMYPITSGGGQGGSSQTPGIKQGNFVFGFFLDGQDQQVPVIMGVLGNNAQTQLSLRTGLTGANNFTPQSGFANASGDTTKNVPDKNLASKSPNSPNTREGACVHQETVADRKQRAVLERPHTIECPNPKCNSEMKGIAKTIEKLARKIENYQQTLQDYATAASLPIKQKLKDIDKELQKAAEKISKFMRSIFTRIQEWVTKQYNEKLQPLLKIAPPSKRSKLLKTLVNGYKLICCIFNKIGKDLLNLILGALRKNLNNRKNQSPPPPATQPQLNTTVSLPPLPREGTYAPIPLCTTEELVGEVLGATLNEIMEGYSAAVGPVITEVQSSSGSSVNTGSSGSSPLVNAITEQNVLQALESGNLVSALTGTLANAIGADAQAAGLATRAFQRGDFSNGIISLAQLAGKDAGNYASALVAARSAIDAGDLVGGLTSLAEPFGVDQKILRGVGDSFSAIREGNISALTRSVGSLAGVDPNITNAVVGLSRGDIGGLLNVVGASGPFGGMNFDVAAALLFVSSITAFFDCDPSPKCPPSDTHTLQSGAGNTPEPSLLGVARTASTAPQRDPLARASFDPRYDRPSPGGR